MYIALQTGQSRRRRPLDFGKLLIGSDLVPTFLTI
jgi:hypothetical protein